MRNLVLIFGIVVKDSEDKMSSIFNKVCASISVALENEGFKSRDYNYIRVRAEFIDCISIQLRSDKLAFTINLGVQPGQSHEG